MHSLDETQRGDIGSTQVGLTLSHVAPQGFVNAFVSRGKADLASSRAIIFGNLDRRATGSRNGDDFGAYAEVGRTFSRRHFQIEPIASLQYRESHEDPSSEIGADALNLTFNSSSIYSLQSGLGARLSHQSP